MSVNYGTTAGTACQGNDGRLSDARTPTSHASTDATYGVGSSTNYGHVKVDAGPISGSPNAVSSNGVYTALDAKAIKATSSTVSISSGTVLSSIVSVTTYLLPNSGSCIINSSAGSIGDRIYFTCTSCSTGSITVNGVTKSGVDGHFGVLAEKWHRHDSHRAIS